MELNKREKKLLELAANGGTDKELVLFEQMNELEDKFDSTIEEIKKSVPDLDKVLATVKGKDAVLPTKEWFISLIKPLIPEAKPGNDGNDYVLTEQDKQQIARSIKVPVIEKTVERTEVIREQPIVTEITKITNEIKEVAVADTPDEVIGKINQSKLFISKERVDGLMDALGQMVHSAVGVTTTIFFKGGTQVGRAKNINFTGSAVSSVTVVGDTAQVTLTGGSGGGQVNSVVAGTGISVDSTDPANPIVTATGGGTGTVTSVASADGSVTVTNPTTTADLAVVKAPKLTTARTIDGQSFDGTANITVIAPGTHAATGKTTPVDADELPIVDSAASNVLKKLTWANVKTTLKTYFDTLYPSGSGTSSGTNTGDQTITLTGDVTGTGNGSFAATVKNALKDFAHGFTTSGTIVTGKVSGFYTAPQAATIVGWNLTVDAGTMTVKVWKIASGTAKPTVANVINTNGVAISTGTAIQSTTVSDFTTTAIAAGDILAFQIFAVSGVADATFELIMRNT